MKLLFFTFCLLAFCPAGRSAEPAAAQDPCEDDLRRFCPAVSVSSAATSAMWDCVDAHHDDLSAGCRKLYDDILSRAESPCATEAARLCPGVKRAQGRMYNCLKSNEEKLPATCRRFTELSHSRWLTRERQAQDRLKPCAADMRKLCPGLPALSGELLPCLTAHRQRLAAACRDLIFPR